MKASKVFFLVFLSIISLCVVNTHPVKAQVSGTIYIRVDGSVDPPTAPIQPVGNVYTFTSNIYDYSIVVQRDNIVVDGAGHTLQGPTGANFSIGIDLSYRSNVTIRNMQITYFVNGIYLETSSNNTITRNFITNNNYGIVIYDSSNNTIMGNFIINNGLGIGLYISSNNIIYWNKFINNQHQAYCSQEGPSVNIWYDSYPSSGNYWSDYKGVDANGDGIGDIPYIIDGNNQDNYPLMPYGAAVISIVSPENKTYTVNHVSLTFTVSKPTSWVGYSLDGQANVTITGNTTLSGLPDGSHSLIVYAKDTAGNTGASETIYFTIAQQSEAFPTTWIVAAIAIIAICVAITLGAVTYRRKRLTSSKTQ